MRKNKKNNSKLVTLQIQLGDNEYYVPDVKVDGQGRFKAFREDGKEIWCDRIKEFRKVSKAVLNKMALSGRLKRIDNNIAAKAAER